MLIAFLLIVTFASLALSAGLLTYVLRLTREERDRSEARAAALEQALAASHPIAASHPVATSEPIPLPEPAAATKPLELWSPEMTFAEEAARREAAQKEAPFALSALYEPTPRARFVVPAVGVLAVALIGGLGIAAVWTRSQVTGTAAAAQESTGAPLELVSLKHERVGDGLHISGVVRNPQDGRLLKGLAAVAFLFDRDGNYLSSDRAPLDYIQLQPGEESPFSIAVPSAAGVSRYRVTFRTDAGIVAHVDRRSDPPVVPAASR